MDSEEIEAYREFSDQLSGYLEYMKPYQRLVFALIGLEEAVNEFNEALKGCEALGSLD